jgi:hypothetical protein
LPPRKTLDGPNGRSRRLPGRDHPRGGKALEAAQQAHALAKGPAEMGAHAAAHAELGHFDMAALWQGKAIATAPADAKEQNRDRLKRHEPAAYDHKAATEAP